MAKDAITLSTARALIEAGKATKQQLVSSFDIIDDAEADVQTSAPAPAKLTPVEKIAARGGVAKAGEQRGILGRTFDVAKDAVTQNVKDTAGAVVSLGEGMITAIPELTEAVPGVVGEASKDFTETFHRNARDTREFLGSGERGAVTAAPQMLGATVALAKPTVKASQLVTKGVAAVEKAAGITGLAARAAKGNRWAQLGMNLVEGQFVSFLATIGRDSEGQSKGEMLREAAEFDAALTVGIATLPPSIRGALYVARKGREGIHAASPRMAAIDNAITRQFRWLGNVSDEVRGVFEGHFRSVSVGKAEAMEWAEDVSKLTRAERLRVGQRLRGSITSDVPREQLDEAARRGYLEFDEQIKAANADPSLAQASRQKRVQDLRQQQRDLMKVSRDELEPIDEITERGRALLDRESQAMRQRKELDRVYYEKLTKGELAEMRQQRGELTDTLKKDLQTFNQKSVKAEGGNPQVEQLLDGLPNIVALTKGEVRAYGDGAKALQKELETLMQSEPFAGRAGRIRDTVQKIEAINESIQTSYKFGSGGTKWSPRMYLSKAEEQALDNLRITRGPKLDGTLTERRDVFTYEGRTTDRAKFEIEREQLQQRAGELDRMIGEPGKPANIEPVGDSEAITKKDLRAERAKVGRRLTEIEEQLPKLESTEIIDPTFPVAKRVQDLVSDRAATELFDTLAKRADVVSSTEQKGFVQLTGKTLGALDGKWVSKDIAGEIRAIGGVKDDAWRWYDALLRVWKTNKTALNPATHARNVLGNTIFLDAAGVNTLRQPGEYADFAEQLRSSSPMYREFRRTGLGAGTYAHADLERLAGMANDVPDGEWYDRISRYYELPVVRDFVRAYNLEDEAARFVLFKRARTELNLTFDQSIDYVDRYIPNYRKVPNTAVSRVAGVMQPFYKFTWSATPILIKNFAENPVQFAKWWALGRAVNELSARSLGISEEQEGDVRGVLPTYMQHGERFAPSVMPLLPRRDQYGRTLFLDTSYWIPGNNLVDDSGGVLPTQMLDIGNPAIRTIAELRSNIQFYNQRPIYDPVLDVDKEASQKVGRTVLTPEGYGKVAKYLYNQAVPTIAGWGAERIYRAITKSTDYAGRVQPVDLAVLDALFGVKTRAVDVDEQKRFRVLEQKKERGRVIGAIRSTARDQRLDDAERAEKTEELVGRLRAGRGE